MGSTKMNQLKEDALQFGVELNEKQLSQFQKYYEMLIEWNEKINLTAITEFEEVLKKHFPANRQFYLYTELSENTPTHRLHTTTTEFLPATFRSLQAPM